MIPGFYNEIPGILWFQILLSCFNVSNSYVKDF